MRVESKMIVIERIDITKFTDAELLDLHNKLIAEEKYEGCIYTQEEIDKRKTLKDN